MFSLYIFGEIFKQKCSYLQFLQIHTIHSLTIAFEGHFLSFIKEKYENYLQGLEEIGLDVSLESNKRFHIFQFIPNDKFYCPLQRTSPRFECVSDETMILFRISRKFPCLCQ